MLSTGIDTTEFPLFKKPSLKSQWIFVLRSAVGMTHSLRSDLWWTIPFRVLLGHFGVPIVSLTIKPTLARHTGVRRVFGSRQSDHVITFGQSQSTYHIQPLRCTWVVLWLFCFRSTPQRSLILSPLSRVHFGESLVKRLYSEIDHTYLSIEAQCVSHHYPRWTATEIKHLYYPLICINSFLVFIKWIVMCYSRWRLVWTFCIVKCLCCQGSNEYACSNYHDYLAVELQ